MKTFEVESGTWAVLHLAASRQLPLPPNHVTDVEDAKAELHIIINAKDSHLCRTLAAMILIFFCCMR